jgi:hypothetical protein
VELMRARFLILTVVAAIAPAQAQIQNNVARGPLANQTIPCAVAQGCTGDTGTGAAAFTPSLSCGTATFTVNSASWKQLLGKFTWAEIDFTITAIGTCTQPVTFTLPNTANSAGALSGQEQAATTHSITACSLAAASATATCQKNAGSGNPFLVSDRIVVSGIYENQ